MNVLLIIVGIIFLIGFIIGYKKGFIKIVASLVITLATLVLVMMISPTVSKFLLNHTPIERWVEKNCTKVLAEKITNEVTRDEEIAMIENSGLPEYIQNLLIDNNHKEVKGTLGAANFQEYVTKYLAKLIADILAFLLVFLVITILARILMCVFDILAKLPVVGGLNRILGGATGLIFALLVVWVACVIITLLYQTKLATTCLAYINQSPTLKWLYDNNMLLKMITK